MKIDSTLIPITDEVSVESIFISYLSSMAFPDPFEFMTVIDKLIDQAADETFDPRLPYKINEKITEIRYFQLLWEAILKKGRDENYV
jgi:hypothetical protein